jgi:hypothetical protein
VYSFSEQKKSVVLLMRKFARFEGVGCACVCGCALLCVCLNAGEKNKKNKKKQGGWGSSACRAQILPRGQMEPHPRFEWIGKPASLASTPSAQLKPRWQFLPYELWSYCCRSCIAAPHFVRIRHVALECKQADCRQRAAARQEPSNIYFKMCN